MFVASIKFSTIKAAAILLALGAIIAAALWTRGQVAVQADVFPKYAGIATNAKRVQFLEGYGWKVVPDPVEVVEVTIPQSFNVVYNNYNALQKAQGFNLEGYKGRRVKRWTYRITNFPGVTDEVRGNLLIFNNVVIGGDVSTVALNGFMQGLSKNSAQLTAGVTPQNSDITKDIFTVTPAQ
jgi:hypothetical protein